MIRFDYDQRTYAGYNTGGKFFATDGICTHGNAHLADGIIFGDMIECPKHNGRFSIVDGSPKRNPVCVGIKTYTVETVNGVLYMVIDEDSRKPGSANEENIKFNVFSNRNLTPYIKELVLEKPEGERAFLYEPGQYAQFIIPPYQYDFSNNIIEKEFVKFWKEQGLFDLKVENSIYLKRNFSFASNPQKDRHLKFNVRLSLPPPGTEAGPGKGSSYIFSLKPGDSVELTGPQGEFRVKTSDREMIYLGGGAGMAPLRSHLSYLFESEKTNRKVSLWYGAKSIEDLFYTEYFRELEQRFQNFHFRTALSGLTGSDRWRGSRGLIHEVLFEQYLGEHPDPTNVEYYLCGPPPMIQAALKMLNELSVPAELVAFDEFD